MRIASSQDTHVDAGFEAFRELISLVYRLRRAHRDITILATSSVHPRNPMPVEHWRLLDALATSQDHSRPPAPTFSAIFSKWCLCLLVALWDTFTILQVKVRYHRLLARRKQERASIVLKTWRFGPDSVDASADFYYGAFPAELVTRDVSTLLLCGNVQARREIAFARKVFRLDRFRAVPESALVPLWGPILSVFHQLRSSLILRRQAASEKDRKFAVVCAQVAMDCVHPATMRNAMNFHIAQAVARYWKPDVYVTLYEGQPWEKLAWQGMKAARPECVIAGYQHTVVMRHSLSLTNPNTGSWEVSTPDVVLCLGPVTRRMMAPAYEPTGTKLVVFGSHRRGEMPVSSSGPKPYNRMVLVTPEGNIPECKILFEFAMQVAPLAPNYRFIFRCHPMLPFEKVRPHLEQHPEDFANVEVSAEDSIPKDFERCSVLLYRGSSAVFYAVLEGLLPVYLRTGESFDVDPLFELDSWRQHVSSKFEMAELLQHYGEIQKSEAKVSWSAAFAYINGYTVSVQDRSIADFLSAVGMTEKASRS